MSASWWKPPKPPISSSLAGKARAPTAPGLASEFAATVCKRPFRDLAGRGPGQLAEDDAARRLHARQEHIDGADQRVPHVRDRTDRRSQFSHRQRGDELRHQDEALISKRDF